MKKIKWMFLCFTFVLCFIYSGQIVQAKTTTTTKTYTRVITVSAPDYYSDVRTAKDVIEEKLRIEYNLDSNSELKILKCDLIDRIFNIVCEVKFTKYTAVGDIGLEVAVPGLKKGAELQQQVTEAAKKSHPRIESVGKIHEAQLDRVTYDVEYQITTKKETTNTSSSKKAIGLNITSTYLSKGETLQLKINNLPKKVTELSWSSRNNKVATVSKKGLITGVGLGSTEIEVSFYSGKQYYYYSCYVTVYKVNGFVQYYGTIVQELKIYRGESLEIYLDIDGADDSIESAYLPLSRMNAKVTTTSGDMAKIERKSFIGNDGVEYFLGYFIDAYRDGVITITMTDNKKTYKLKIIVGTGVTRLDPVVAVQKNDFTGYEGSELLTLKTVREFFDKNDMFSKAMSIEQKLNYIADYFIATWHKEKYVPYEHGSAYMTMIQGIGVCADYTETVCFLLDCLGIKNTESSGSVVDNDGFAAHAWNRVEIDGKWYFVDFYWCANLGEKKRYFITETLWDDHVMFHDENPYINLNGDVSYIRTIH